MLAAFSKKDLRTWDDEYAIIVQSTEQNTTEQTKLIDKWFQQAYQSRCFLFGIYVNWDALENKQALSGCFTFLWFGIIGF